MIQPKKLPSSEHPNRRDFLKTSMVGAATAATMGGLSLARGAHAAGSDVIRIGLVGCGGRGPGAALNAMTVDRGVRLVAMTDIFADRVQSRRQMLKNEKPKEIAGLPVTGIDTTDGFKYRMADGGWLLIRFSGTEPIIRVYTETTHQDKVSEILNAGLELAGLKE